jgi:hypothetical protein
MTERWTCEPDGLAFAVLPSLPLLLIGRPGIDERLLVDAVADADCIGGVYLMGPEMTISGDVPASGVLDFGRSPVCVATRFRGGRDLKSGFFEHEHTMQNYQINRYLRRR